MNHWTKKLLFSRTSFSYLITEWTKSSEVAPLNTVGLAVTKDLWWEESPWAIYARTMDLTGAWTRVEDSYKTHNNLAKQASKELARALAPIKLWRTSSPALWWLCDAPCSMKSESASLIWFKDWRNIRSWCSRYWIWRQYGGYTATCLLINWNIVMMMITLFRILYKKCNRKQSLGTERNNKDWIHSSALVLQNK